MTCISIVERTNSIKDAYDNESKISDLIFHNMFTIHYITGKKFTIDKVIDGVFDISILQKAGYFRCNDDPNVESLSIYVIKPIETMLSNYRAITSKEVSMLITYHNILCESMVSYLHQQGYTHVAFTEKASEVDNKVSLPGVKLGYMKDDALLKILSLLDQKF